MCEENMYMSMLLLYSMMILEEDQLPDGSTSTSGTNIYILCQENITTHPWFVYCMCDFIAVMILEEEYELANCSIITCDEYVKDVAHLCVEYCIVTFVVVLLHNSSIPDIMETWLTLSS